MKKTIILLFGVCLLLNGIELNKSENNSSKKEYKYIYKTSKRVLLDKNGTEGKTVTFYEVLNKKGQVLQLKEPNNLIEYSYNDKGQKIKEVRKNLLEPKDITTTYYSYDNKGALKEIKILNANDKVQNIKKINKDDNNTKMEYDRTGKLIKKVKDTYASSGHTNRVGDSKDSPYKPIDRTEYYKKEITTYTYDKAGNEVKKEFLDRYDHIDKQVYTYDEKGKLLSENNTSDHNHTIKEHYIIYKEYDSRNNLTKEYSEILKSTSYCKGGGSYYTPNYELSFSYDKENRVVKIEGIKVYFNEYNYRYRTDITYKYGNELLF